MNSPRFAAILLLLFLCFLPAVAESADQMSTAKIGNVLHCLGAKLSTIGYAPPHFAAHTFRVRYVLGVVDKDEDLKNELHLVAYGRDEKKAILYEVYFENRDGRPSIYIGEAGTLKQQKGIMEPDEIWGGVGTYYEVKRLLRVVSARPPISISDDEVVAGPRVCVFEH